MWKFHFNLGNITDSIILHNTPLHSRSTQLNYEWRSILREGNYRAGVSTREELRGFCGKIKRKKSFQRWRVLSTRTIQKLIQYAHSVHYPTDLSFGMQFSYATSLLHSRSSPLKPNRTDTLTSNLKMNGTRDSLNLELFIIQYLPKDKLISFLHN